MSRYYIGLDSWIIQDGNYGDFVVGEEYRFAVEFTPSRLASASPGVRSLSRVRGCEYEALAEVVVAEPRLTVLDAGLKCFHDGGMEEDLAVGSWAAGRLSIGVDPFFWAESHSKRDDLPDLAYRWRVCGIGIDTTPSASGGEGLQAEDGRGTYRAVQETDAWNDEDGRAIYLLECELLTAI